MAGQFDKFVKILGNSSRPARYKGAPGNPDIVATPDVVAPENPDAKTMRETGVTSSGIGDSMAVARQQKSGRSKLAADAKARDFSRSKATRAKIQNEHLSTTTMRLDSKTGEAYDTEEVKPPASGRVKPTRQANPKYVAADFQRQNEDTKSFTDADSKRNVGDQDSTGEAAFSQSEKEKGSPLRSLNGVTYDMNDYGDYLKGLPANQISKATAPYDVSEFEPKSTTGSLPRSAGKATPAPVVKEGPNKSEDPTDYNQDPSFLKVKKVKARKGGTVYGEKVIDDIERESQGPTTYEYGDTVSPKNKKSTFKDPLERPKKATLITERPTAVVEGDIPGAAYADVPDPKRPGYSVEGSDLAPGYDDPNDIRSTTMREVPAEGPAKVLGHVPVRSPREAAGYDKPTVNKPGNVIPPAALDTFGSQPVDKVQAETENKRLRESRVVARRTTVVDPNVLPSRPARGKTPERQAVLAGIREERAASLAAEGKDMTTVRPDIMATAKGLGRTSMYNLDNDYMDSPSFLSHEAVQKATVAHALGVHHTLGTDDDHLHRYLGGKPLEAKSRLTAAYKVVDRNLRGNPEKVPGEFALLRGMVHAGSSPQETLRTARSGKPGKVVVNGQNVTLAAGSSENRQKIADTTTNITAQAEAAPKIARGSVAATPTAPLAGTGRVAVRSIGQSPDESEIREFSPQERRNLQTNVPTSDDTKNLVADESKVKPAPMSKKDALNSRFAARTAEFSKQDAERKNLKTTTMRLNAKTGEAYDYEENK